MATKKDGKNMLDMLERMGMVRKETDDLDNTALDDDNIIGYHETGIADTEFEEDFFAEPQNSNQESYQAAQSLNSPSLSSVPAHFVYESSPVYVAPVVKKDEQPIEADYYWADTKTGVSGVDRYLEIDELYTNMGFALKGTNTIYIIEEYLNTLPDSLPADVRRTIILKIVAASGFDFEKLLNDGIERVTKLSEHAGNFSKRTDELIAKFTSDIADLERKIQEINDIISERKNVHKKQFLTIEDETQRLREILDFITK